jgi:formylglycine-generating enzyme required for sulfatase activity/sugar lactone lactonase YvrE
MPWGVAVDGSGNVYVADTNNSRIRKITASGDVTTLAGSGSPGYGDGQGAAASFSMPRGVAVDASGNVYVADTYNVRVRKITASGNVTTLAGSGSPGFGDGQGIVATFMMLWGVSVDGSGNVYVADMANHRIRKISIGPKISISGTMPEPTLNQAYAGYSFTVMGATGAPVWSVSSGSLPPGMSFNATTATLSGTPTTAGNYTFTIQVASGGYSDELEVVLKVSPMILVQGGILPSGSGLEKQIVQSFQISRTEATWDEWQEVRTWAVANGYSDLTNVGAGSEGSHPVRLVSWYDVVKWCNAKSEKEGLVPVYQVGGAVYKTGQSLPTVNSAANGYRVPTEAEWEWAARGGASSQGYTYSGSNDVNAVAWCWDNSSGAVVIPSYGSRGTWPVGAKAANELGICDMSGNVNEWCWDASTSGNQRPRGGSWGDSANLHAVAHRNYFYNADIRTDFIGFRLVRNIGPKISINSTSPEAILNQFYAGFSFTASGVTSAPVWSVSSGTLPSGISFNATTATLSGTPTTAGNYTFTIKAAFGGYSDETQVVFKVAPTPPPIPVITSGTSASGTVGTAFTYQITATNNATAYGASGLPAGLTLNATSGRIRGTPTAAGNFTVNLTATNAGGTSNATLELAVVFPLPVVAITTLAGSFNWPSGVALDESGNLFVADSSNHRIQKITASGNVTTLAGGGGSGWNGSGSANGSGTSAGFCAPGGLAVDRSGFVYVADTGNNLIRKITAGGNVTTLAGSGSSSYADGFRAAASFNYPSGVGVDKNGNVYVADSNNNRIRKITASGSVTTLAGSGISSYSDGNGTSASFKAPLGLSVDGSGFVYVADTYNHILRKITSSGNVTTLDYSGTETMAGFSHPQGVAVDGSGNIFVADTYNHMIRRIDLNGTVMDLTRAGEVYFPSGIAVDAHGDVYIADSGNNRIRKITIGPKIVANGTLPNAKLNDTYVGFIFGSTGVNAPITWSTNGTLPPGMSFNATVAKLSGIPSTAGNYTFTIRLDSGGYSDEVEVQLSVEAPPVDIVTVQGGTLPAGSGLVGQSVKAFQIGKYEVTWNEWQTVCAWAVANGYNDLNGIGNGRAGNNPVQMVSWYDVVKWCNAKSQMEGLAPVYQLNGGIYKSGQSVPTLDTTADGYRLPLEMEWEWAARGGLSSSNYTYSGSNDLNAVAWFNNNANAGTNPIGTKLANELGIHDMSGNVWEWCWDIYENQNSVRRARGGSFLNFDFHSATDWRGYFTYYYESDRLENVGFRFARSIQPAAKIFGFTPTKGSSESAVKILGKGLNSVNKVLITAIGSGSSTEVSQFLSKSDTEIQFLSPLGTSFTWNMAVFTNDGMRLFVPTIPSSLTGGGSSYNYLPNGTNVSVSIGGSCVIILDSGSSCSISSMGGSNTFFVKSGASLSLGPGGGGNKVYYESGAIISASSGTQTILVNSLRYDR